MDKLKIALRGANEEYISEDFNTLVDKCAELNDDFEDEKDRIFYFKRGNINQWRIIHEHRGGHPENIPAEIKNKTIFSIIIHTAATIKATDAIMTELKQHSPLGIAAAEERQKIFINAKEVEALAWFVWDAADDLVKAQREMELTKSQTAQMKIIMKLMKDAMHTNAQIREYVVRQRCDKCSCELVEMRCFPCDFEFIN